MKFYIIDDEHSLYKRMFSDLLDGQRSDVQELPKFYQLPKPLSLIRPLIFNDRINRHLWLPGKDIFQKYYSLSNLKFDDREKYWLIFLNGSLRSYYSKEYFLKLKQEHPNVKLAMIMYDHFGNRSAKRAIDMIPVFDHVFSFDSQDCRKYGLDFIYSTFSIPKFVHKSEEYSNNALFVGLINGRERLLNTVLPYIAQNVDNCRFYLVGVKKNQQKYPQLIKYNHPISYDDELKLAYNSNCIIEILKEGQTGISLRTCEAIAFNKKLITNNHAIEKMPFYNPKYMRIIDSVDDVDIDFIKEKIPVNYNYSGYFSPMEIIKKLSEVSW